MTTPQTDKQLIGQAGQLLASIKELLTANNLTEVDLSDLDEEQTDTVYVIWYDKHCDPNDDPVLKVFLDQDGLSLEVDARNFGNTVRLYEDDFAHEVNWLTGIRDNMVETLRLQGIAVELPSEDPFSDLADREWQWQKEVRALLIDTLREHGGRIMFTLESPHDEYPVTTTLYDQHDFPRVDICSLHLDGDTILADGYETEEGSGEERCDLRIEDEHLSDAFSFVRHTLKSLNKNA